MLLCRSFVFVRYSLIPAIYITILLLLTYTFNTQNFFIFNFQIYDLNKWRGNEQLLRLFMCFICASHPSHVRIANIIVIIKVMASCSCSCHSGHITHACVHGLWVQFIDISSSASASSSSSSSGSASALWRSTLMNNTILIMMKIA